MQGYQLSSTKLFNVLLQQAIRLLKDNVQSIGMKSKSGRRGFSNRDLDGYAKTSTHAIVVAISLLRRMEQSAPDSIAFWAD